MLRQRFHAAITNIAEFKFAILKRYPKLPMYGSASLDRSGWCINKTVKKNEFVIKNDSNGHLILNLKKNDATFYFIHNATSSQLTKIKRDSGIDASRKIVFEVGVICSPGLRSHLVVMRYDKSGSRTKLEKLPTNEVVEITPHDATHRVVVAIAFRGEGTAVINGVRLEFAEHARSADPIFSPNNARRKLPELGVSKQTAEMRAPHHTVVCSSKGISHRLLLDMASALPKSDGCRYYKKLPYKVAIVSDIYMYNFYKDCFAELSYLTPSNYKDILANNTFDIFLYVTCWSGIFNDEWRGVKFRSTPMKAFNAILSHFACQRVPTIFQTIEDPSNFDYFLPIAKRFDYIFTSDSEMVPQYKVKLGHDRVYYGEYGANPLLNNPIGCRRARVNAAFFAGSYPARYPERCHDMKAVFDSIEAARGGLVIADRNFESVDKDVQFPEKYNANIIEPIEHEILQSVHKLFRYNLNFNSIKDSPTMCAMRVYELQAQCVGLVSNYARSVYNKFPGVQLVAEYSDLSGLFEPNDDEYHYNVVNMRGILTEKTCYDIAGRMLRAIGMEGVVSSPTVVVLARRITPSIKACFDRQSYPSAQLVELDGAGDLSTISKCLGTDDYITFFADSEDYETEYIQDMMNAFKYTNARYITKNAFYSGMSFCSGPEHEYTSVMSGKARTVFVAREFSVSELDSFEMLGPAYVPGGYSIDRFSLNHRRQAGQMLAKEHTRYELSVIVPVYNNGHFLVGKSIASLRRSLIWDSLEIILVDDGSTDEQTQGICQELEEIYTNVRTFFFPKGGSGSASRPRNKGIELASAPLIAFLDPDNEISPRGYDHLIELYKDLESGGRPVDFVCGYQVKVGATNTITGRHTSERISVVNDLRRHFFGRGKFPVVSTQAAVLSRELFKNKNLRFVEGAAGQDTLFGWELLASAGSGAFTASAFLLYYHERCGSVTNEVNREYFEKKLILEHTQVTRLRELGLLEHYLDNHFDAFIRNWYLPKLEAVSLEQRQETNGIFRTILSLYGVSPEKYDLESKAQ